MCSGRVDPAFVLRAFELGADGVIVAGCHPADCHYINGNEKTAIRGDFLETFLEDAGVEAQRFKVEWIAGSEGSKFATVVRQMVSDLEKLGPITKEDEKDD
jgi:coenzyme F420-reducing hydrogenase delta subunit